MKVPIDTVGPFR